MTVAARSVIKVSRILIKLTYPLLNEMTPYYVIGSKLNEIGEPGNLIFWIEWEL